MTAPTDICAIVSFPPMNFAQDHISGQQLFLASSEVLKHVLLPRLSGADRARRPRPAGAHMQSHTLLGARHSFQSMAGGHRTLQAQAQVQLCCGR